MSEALRTDQNSLEKRYRIETLDITGTPAEQMSGKSIDVVDVHPYHQKDDVPTLWAPAWACTLPVYKLAITELAKLGRRVISLDHPRFGGSFSSAPSDESMKDYPQTQLRKALNILAVLEKKGIEKTDVIAHSEGAINTVIAAALQPEKFRNIVLYAPAGMTGDDTFMRLLKGFASQGQPRPTMNKLNVSAEERAAAEREGRTIAAYEELPISDEKETSDAANKAAPRYVLKNPLRALREGLDMSHFRIDELVRYLHQEKGVGFVIMSAVDDPVFKTETMQKMVDARMLNGFVTVRGGHGDIGGHPELYVGGAEYLLTQMASTAGTSA